MHGLKGAADSCHSQKGSFWVFLKKYQKNGI